jgi:hypothetical protein
VEQIRLPTMGRYAFEKINKKNSKPIKNILLTNATAIIFARTTDAQWSLFLLKSRTFGLGQTNSGVFGNDEFELEFSSLSRAELWRFRAEPSWGI